MQSPSGFGLFCQVLLSLKFSLKYFRSGFLPVKTGKDNMDFNNLFFFFLKDIVNLDGRQFSYLPNFLDFS